MTEIARLERIVYGKSAAAADDNLSVLALSDGLSPEDAEIWWGLAAVEPRPDAVGAESLAVGLFNGPDRSIILALAHHRTDAPEETIYQYVMLPRAFLIQAPVNLQTLITLAQDSLPDAALTVPLTPLIVADLQTIPPVDRVAFFTEYFAHDDALSLRALLTVLDAALGDPPLVIRAFPPDLTARITFIQALVLLLPPPARPELTFVTHPAASQTARARICFESSSAEETSSHRTLDIQNAGIEMTDLSTRYAQCLADLWQDDLVAFLTQLDRLAANPAVFAQHPGLSDALDAIALRYTLDREALSGGDIPVEVLLDVLRSAPPEPGDLRLHYVRLLLAYALQDRHADAAQVAARYMDDDSALRESLLPVFDQVLEDEPDAVYFFVRTHLLRGVSPDWLPLLQRAAAKSLNIAVKDGDNDIILKWLELIAREPAGYALQSVLVEGIHQARERARKDGELGQRLVLFTCKRVPVQIESLLDDPDIIAIMAAPLGPALRDYDAESVSETIGLGMEIALVLMRRAAQDAARLPEAAAVFSPASVDYVWALKNTNELLDNFPMKFLPTTLITQWVESGDAWMPAESRQLLLTYVVSDEDMALLGKMAPSLAKQDALYAALASALQNSHLPPQSMLEIVHQMKADDLLTAQQAVNIHLRLIEYHNWEYDQVQPFIDQIARIAQQQPDITLPIDSLWQMLRVVYSGEADIVSRVITRRILAHVGTIEDNARLVEMMTRLHNRLDNDTPNRLYLLGWWRDFTHQQPVKRLQQIAQQLEKMRALESVRAILQTGIAIKKAVGTQPFQEFSAAIHTTYTVLTALSESFDPVNRPSFELDVTTVRAEFELRGAQLSSDERRVLAKNLKELAHLITLMAEHRSKSSIMRREEDIERQLLNGEQTPHSAIDTLKWLSGYFNGTQSRPDEGE